MGGGSRAERPGRWCLTVDEKYLRIATWNLMRARPGGSTRIRALVSLMEDSGVDIWVLTETHRELSPCPEYACVAHSADVPDREAASGECWVAIWSRLPAEPLRLEAEPDRTAAARVITSTGAPLLAVGTVLPWLSDRRTCRFAAPWRSATRCGVRRPSGVEFSLANPGRYSVSQATSTRISRGGTTTVQRPDARRFGRPFARPASRASRRAQTSRWRITAVLTISA
jgi:hypothetical protein